MGGAPQLKVIGDGAGEAHVAAAEAEDAVLQAQRIHQAFHVGNHLVQGSVAVLRLLDADNFHFVELVQAVEAAHIFAVGTGFPAEAGRVGRQLLGELVLLQNHVTEDIGDGDLCGGNHVEPVQIGKVHLAFFVRQLAGTKAGSGIHHHGRLHLLVPGRRVAVQEEVDEGALQAGSLAFVYRETGAGDFDAQVKVDDVVLFGKFPVGEGTFRKIHLRTAHFHYQVVFCAFSFRYQLIGEVGKEDELALQGLDGFVGLFEQLRGTGFEVGDLFLGGSGLFLFAFFHELANGGRSFLLFCQEGIALCLEGFAFVVQGDNLCYDVFGIEVFNSKSPDYKIRRLA